MADITITGNIVGVGSIDYRVNNSKSSAYNPQLIVENTPYNPGDFPIAAMEYVGYSPNKIISITSKSEEFLENTKEFESIETLVYNNSGSYPIYHYPYSTNHNEKLKYLVTEFSSDIQNGKPLFYQYEPRYNVSSNISGIVNINIYKNNEIKLKPEEYKIQYTYSLLSLSVARYSAATWGPVSSATSHRIRVLLPYEFHDKETFYTIEYNKIVNGITTYQKELIEITPIYNTSDYSITSSGLVVTAGGRLQTTGTPLKIVKDPDSRIKALDLVTIKDQNYLSDRVAQWKLRLQLGSFFVASGFYTTNSERVYNLEDFYSSGNYIPITNVRPKIISTNVIKLKEAPIYIAPSGMAYPNYQVHVYDKELAAVTDQSGTFAVDVNGVTRSDLTVKSIDRKKGFVELNGNIDPTDEVEVSFYLDNDGWVLLENLELNYKVNDSVSEYHISGYANGLGLALRPWDNLSGTFYPYIYDTSVAEDSRTAYSLVPIPETDSVGVAWTSYDFFPICELDVNRLTPNMVKLTDARRAAGGIDRISQLDEWLKTTLGKATHEMDWYTDRGYYDGAPLAHAGNIIVHIPNEALTTERQKWINYYEDEVKGNQEFEFYLDQVIRRHLSAGTNYILVPTVSGLFQEAIKELR